MGISDPKPKSTFRECGECRACVDKFPALPDDGNEKRRCSTWHCVWLADIEGIMLDEDLRPDKSGVIVEQGRDDNGGDVLQLIELVPHAVDKSPWPTLLDRLQQHMHVYRSTPGGRRYRIRARTSLINHSGVLNFLRHRTKDER